MEQCQYYSVIAFFKTASDIMRLKYQLLGNEKRTVEQFFISFYN